MTGHVVGIHKANFAIGSGRKAQFSPDCSCGWTVSLGSGLPKSGTREWAQSQALWHQRESASAIIDAIVNREVTT